MAEGQRQGKAEGMAEALLATLAARGVALDDADRARILEERDPERILAWIGRAATCGDIAELFGKR
jgi:hypothetical protein